MSGLLNHGRNGRSSEQALSELLKRRDEHPGRSCNHADMSTVAGEAESAIDEASAEIALGIGVVVLHPRRYPFVHIGSAHVWRIRHNDVVALRQR